MLHARGAPKYAGGLTANMHSKLYFTGGSFEVRQFVVAVHRDRARQARYLVVVACLSRADTAA